MLKSKKGVFTRLSDAAFGIKRPEYRKVSRDSFFGSCPVIDADYVEISEDSTPDSTNNSNSASNSNSAPNSNSTPHSNSIPHSNSAPNIETFDSELLEKLWDYLKTRSQEEISEIFEEVRKIMESREAKTNLKDESDGGFKSSRGRGSPYNEKMNVRENLKSAFRFCSETATLGMERVISFSKVASATASSIASDGKESIKVSSKMLNNKWNDLSPRDRKIITEVIIALIEIGLLRGSSKGKKAAFAVLSSVTKHQTPSRSDLEEFMAGAERFFKGRR